MDPGVVKRVELQTQQQKENEALNKANDVSEMKILDPMAEVRCRIKELTMFIAGKRHLVANRGS